MCWVKGSFGMFVGKSLFKLFDEVSLTKRGQSNHCNLPEELIVRFQNSLDNTF
jgi:hypothetical protein